VKIIPWLLLSTLAASLLRTVYTVQVNKLSKEVVQNLWENKFNCDEIQTKLEKELQEDLMKQQPKVEGFDEKVN
jgi:hypothetical protein